MASLKDLVNNLPNFRYYSGVGTFESNDLPYGKDRPGGGDSNQPYIKREIGQRWSPSNIDIPLNNGVITTTSRSAADVLRISKFFIDLPKGPLWLAKQVGLQLMNPKIQHDDTREENAPTRGQGFFRNLGNAISNTANRIQNDLGPTRIYNPLGITTLAQVGVNAFGVHFNRHGLLPRSQDTDTYEKAANGSMRMVNLATKLSSKDTPDYQKTIIDEYKGGPDSILGIGNTTIRRFGQGMYIADDLANDVSNFTAIPISTLYNINGNGSYVTPTVDTSQTKLPRVFAIGQNSGPRKMVTINNNGEAVLMNPNEADELSRDLEQFDFSKKDFREYKNNFLITDDNKKLTSSDYENINVERRIGVIGSRNPSKYNSNPTMISGSRTSYSAKGPTDSVNMISLYSAQAAGDYTETVDINGNPVNTKIIRDLIKFRIKSFDNDRTDETGVYMVFRAFLTGDINDSMIANWTAYSYVGRGENFYNYDGFEAGITLSFKVVAFSRQEMKPLYQKLNYLKSNMAPDYSKSGKMRGNIMELTVGDYIKYQPGIITALNISIPEDAGWEIALDYFGEDKDMHELPMMLDVSLSFIPIYRFLPRKSASLPFIGIQDSRKDYKDVAKVSVARDWLNGNEEKLKPSDKK